MIVLLRRCLLVAVTLGALLGAGSPAEALPETTLEAVVSVLPMRPGQAEGRVGPGRRVAPEGSGVVIGADGLIATAWHVVEGARRIDVRLFDGRVLPARLLAHDAASDIALLQAEGAPAPIAIGPRPALAERACAIGNAFGLGLSVTCGVVSARAVSDAGFNAVEDFLQTDAATNPGVSGGALVDAEGRLIGMMSAIFASEGDGDLGVNFAVSTELLLRVTAALQAEGRVAYPRPGWRLRPASRAQLAEMAGAVAAEVASDGPAARAGVAVEDVILRIGARRIKAPRDAIAALAILPPDQGSVEVAVLRDGAELLLQLELFAAAGAARAAPDDASEAATAGAAAPDSAPEGVECPHPAPVCAARQAVFPISSFMPIASATRIGPDLLATNRHNVADERVVTVFTPDGPREGRVVDTAYRGDLALVQVAGLPEDGRVMSFAAEVSEGPLFAVGADVGRQVVRVFAPGQVLAPPDPEAPLGRLHVSARMQPGVSGGALVDATGALVGVAAGGGDGRFEAIPVGDVAALLELREAADAEAVQRALGAAMAQCSDALDRAQAGDPEAPGEIAQPCRAALNQGQLLAAGRVLARARDIDGAIEMHELAVAQTPNSINARLSLLVSLQLGGRFEEMTTHARWVMEAAPEDPGALRFSIQAGVWGDDLALAEEGYQRLLAADPRQAEAARRFIDNAPPRPPRR